MKDQTLNARPDAMDRAAGLSPAGRVYDLRALRPEFVDGAEACRVSVLAPEDDLGLAPELRQAVARRVALGATDTRLHAEYLPPADPALQDLANGRTPQDPRLRALARHTDLIAATPGAATAEDLSALQAAGFTVPQIIALSELLAYAAFQMRVAHGLALLEDPA